MSLEKIIDLDRLSRFKGKLDGIIGDPQDLTTENKGTIVEAINEVNDKAEIFYATYDVTTAEEIEAAYQAGKTIICIYYVSYLPLAYRSTNLNDPCYTFAGIVNPYVNNPRVTSVTRGSAAWYVNEIDLSDCMTRSEVSNIIADTVFKPIVLLVTDGDSLVLNMAMGDQAPDMFINHRSRALSDFLEIYATGMHVEFWLPRTMLDGGASDAFADFRIEALQGNPNTGAITSATLSTTVDGKLYWAVLTPVSETTMTGTLHSMEVPTKVSDLTNDSGFVDAVEAAAAAPVQSVNGKTGTVVLNASDVGAGTYSKPSGGIPKSDLANDVQTSLSKADTALQNHQSLAAYRTAVDQDIIDAAQDTAIAGKLSATGNAYRAASIPMGHLDSTSTATVMTATVPGITELRDGVCMWLRNGVITSAANFTLNINGLGAKPCYSSLAAASRSTTIFNVNYTMLFVYNSTRVEGGCWDIVHGVDTNTTYTPPKLGFGYATCSTAEATAAKTAALSSYTLTTGGIVAVKFTNAVPANATLNINSKGAKAIYYQGAAITAGVIKAGDTVTMIYSTYYHVLSIDGAFPSPSLGSPADISVIGGHVGNSTDYARADHTHYFDLANAIEDVPAANIPVILYDDNNGVVINKILPQTLINIYRHQPKLNLALIAPPNYNDYPVIFTASSLNTTTGELHLTGITGGVLYEATLLPGLDPIGNDGIAMVGTMTTTNLALPSAQGVSF